MRALAGHVASVVLLQLLGGCGSSADHDFFAAASARGGTSAGSSASGGASFSGSGGSATGQAGTGGTSVVTGGTGGSGGFAGSTSNTMFSGDGGFGNDEEPIDDMEDGDTQLLVEAGRDGYWFVIADPTPGAWTSPGEEVDFSMAWNATARGQSVRAAELMGGGFQEWGAGLVFNWRAGSGGPLPSYDASGYSGLSFYARSGQGQRELTVHFADVNSHPDGGLCGSECYRHFHSTVTLGTAWQKVRISFASLQQSEPKGAFTPAKLYAVQFLVEGEATFDLWIDDVAFIR